MSHTRRAQLNSEEKLTGLDVSSSVFCQRSQSLFNHDEVNPFVVVLSLEWGSAGFFPRFLIDIMSDRNFISRVSCFSQMYVIHTYVTHELTLLTVMAYDRYVAICHPLHYHSKMTFRTVLHLLTFAVVYPAFVVGTCLYLSSLLPLCGNKLRRIFCPNWSVVQLSCMDTTVNNIVGRIFIVSTILTPLFFVLYTYLRIIVVCRRSSAEHRGKALQTCLPHIVTFVTYTFSLFCELSLSRLQAHEINTVLIVVLSLEFLIIPPINNPLVYGLNLPQIRGAIFGVIRIHKQTHKHTGTSIKH